MLCFDDIGNESPGINQSRGSLVNYSGELEWLGENSTSELTAYSASMYVVTGKDDNKTIEQLTFVGGLIPGNSAIESGRNNLID